MAESDILIRVRAQAKLAKEQGLATTAAFLTEAADELEQARFLLRLSERRERDRAGEVTLTGTASSIPDWIVGPKVNGDG